MFFRVKHNLNELYKIIIQWQHFYEKVLKWYVLSTFLSDGLFNIEVKTLDSLSINLSHNYRKTQTNLLASTRLQFEIALLRNNIKHQNSIMMTQYLCMLPNMQEATDIQHQNLNCWSTCSGKLLLPHWWATDVTINQNLLFCLSLLLFLFCF